MSNPFLAYTWQAGDISTAMALSGGDLTATRVPDARPAPWDYAGSDAFPWPLKCYFELTIVTLTGNPRVGAAQAGISSLFFDNANGYAYEAATGNKINTGVSTAYGATFAAGDVISVLVDLESLEISFWKNGVDQGVAFTGLLAGAGHHAVINLDTDNDGVTVNFGATAFAYTPPAGYNALPSIEPAGISSAEAFGLMTVLGGKLIVEPVGIASAEAFGLAEVVGGFRQIFPAGIVSAEAFGTLVIKHEISPAGIGSAEAFGGLAFIQKIGVTGIASAEAVNAVRVVRLLALTDNIVYQLTLTGAADGETDLDLSDRLASFQGRLRNDTPSYLSVVVKGFDLAAAIAARPSGELVIGVGSPAVDGTVSYSEIARATLESVREDDGPTSCSFTLSGHQTVAYSISMTRQLAGVKYRSVSGGLVRVRSALDNLLRPGDTADTGTETFVVGSISYAVGPMSQEMEIVEAAA